jgi:hypothetical protein
MQALSSTTPQRLNLYFVFATLESTEKRQILIVISLRPQRKQVRALLEGPGTMELIESDEARSARAG